MGRYGRREGERYAVYSSTAFCYNVVFSFCRCCYRTVKETFMTTRSIVTLT